MLARYFFHVVCTIVFMYCVDIWQLRMRSCRNTGLYSSYFILYKVRAGAHSHKINAFAHANLLKNEISVIPPNWILAFASILVACFRRTNPTWFYSRWIQINPPFGVISHISGLTFSNKQQKSVSPESIYTSDKKREKIKDKNRAVFLLRVLLFGRAVRNLAGLSGTSKTMPMRSP